MCVCVCVCVQVFSLPSRESLGSSFAQPSILPCSVGCPHWQPLAPPWRFPPRDVPAVKPPLPSWLPRLALALLGSLLGCRYLHQLRLCWLCSSFCPSLLLFLLLVLLLFLLLLLAPIEAVVLPQAAAAAFSAASSFLAFSSASFAFLCSNAIVTSYSVLMVSALSLYSVRVC